MKKRNVIFIFVALLGLFFNSFVSAAIQSYTLDSHKVLTEYSECNSSDSVGSFSNDNGVTIYVKKVPSHKWYNFWFDSSVNETLTCKTKDGITRTIGVTVTENSKVYNPDGKNSDSNTNQGNDNSYDVSKNCDSILGSIDDDGSHSKSGLPSVAYVLQKILNFMKFLGPVLAIAFIIVDLVKTVASNDKDSLNKTLKVSVKRLIYAVMLYVFPVLLNFILGLASAHGTCGIQ